MVIYMDNRKRLQSLLMTAILICSLALAMCGCSADFSSAAGDISRVSFAEEPAHSEEAGQPGEAGSPQKSDNAAAAKEADSAEQFLADIPEWAGYAFCYVNGNKPYFAPEEIWTSTQESLDPLDKLGRCGTANSCIGRDGMPTEPRGNISSVEPTGWHTERYDFVEGEALYNRCHLIAHMLSGDDAVPRNLITGTSYMNRDGMLPFETAIYDYVTGTGNHVMYRVKPVFIGDELIARGVHMQAVSVEDSGKGLAFNVYCYNVQPGINIDYKTGDNKLSEDRTMLEEYQAGKFSMEANTLGVIPGAQPSDGEKAAGPSGKSSAEPSVKPSEEPSAENDKKGDEQSSVRSYVLNTNTHKFHYPDCGSVGDMKDKNKQEVEATREDIIARGYNPCGNCHP